MSAVALGPVVSPFVSLALAQGQALAQGSSPAAIGDAVANGSLLVAIPIALLAGLLSFASPCVLPLVPGYLGYVGGVADGSRPGRGRLVGGVGLFILGFTIVFVVFNVVFGIVGLELKQWSGLITRIAGVLIILMGLVFIGLFGIFQRTLRLRSKAATGLIGAPLLGIVFGLGWTPCIGPTLTVVYTLSLGAGDPGRAALLAVCYALGLGIPFVLIALGLGWAVGASRWLRRHVRTVNIVGGVLLIAIGVLMVSGLWQSLLSHLTAVIQGYVPAL